MVQEGQKVKFAVVGYGHIGKRHAEMVRRNDDSELIAICDFLESHEVDHHGEDGVEYYRDLSDLLQHHPEVDVVSICTPNGLHSPMAIEVLNQKRHVVIEKPMGLSKKNCEEVIFSALRNHRQAFCVMQNRYSPPSVWLKEMVESGRLGKIYMVQINCYWNRDERYYKPGNWHGTLDLDGGTLFTQFSHFIDIMYWLFGDIDNINARFKDNNHQNLTEFEDGGVVSFDFVNGGMGCLNFSTSVYDQNLESSLTIIAENGTIQVGGQYMNKVEVCHVKDYEMPELEEAGPANDYGPYKGSAANHHFIIQNVVDTLKEKTTATTNALEGLKVVEIIERIYQSGDRPVKKLK